MTLQDTSVELREIVKRVVPMLDQISTDTDLAVRPRPEKWSRKEILGHLIDSACNNHQKFVRMMQQTALDFPGYRQDDWVLLQKWAQADWPEMILLWESYNQHIAFLIANVDPEHLNHEIKIEGVGPFKLGFIMPDYLEHLKHHVKQIFPEIDLENDFVNVYNA